METDILMCKFIVIISRYGRLLTQLLEYIYCQNASNALGYNSEAMSNAAVSPEMVNALVNRPATGNYPSQDWLETLQDGLLKVAPPGLDKIVTAQSGSEANEIAYKSAFMLHQRLKRGEGGRVDGGRNVIELEQFTPWLP